MFFDLLFVAALFCLCHWVLPASFLVVLLWVGMLL